VTEFRFTSFILNSNTSEVALQFIVKVMQLVLGLNSPHMKTGLRIFYDMNHCIILLQRKRNFESYMTEMQMVNILIVYNC